MPMCKGCKEIVSSLEVKEGLCKSCRENGVPTPKAEEVTTEAEQVEEAKDFFGNVVGVLFALFFLWWVFHGDSSKVKKSEPYKEPTHISITSVGCTSKDDLSDATRAYINGGISAFRHYDCILVIKGQPIKKIKSSYTTTQVLYQIGESKHIVWVGYDTIK